MRMRYRNTPRRLNEATSYDRVYRAAQDLVNYLRECPLSPSDIEFRVNEIDDAVDANLRTYSADRVYKVALKLDGDRDAAALARKYAEEVYGVVEEVKTALSTTFNY